MACAFLLLLGYYEGGFYSVCLSASVRILYGLNASVSGLAKATAQNVVLQSRSISYWIIGHRLRFVGAVYKKIMLAGNRRLR